MQVKRILRSVDVPSKAISGVNVFFVKSLFKITDILPNYELDEILLIVLFPSLILLHRERCSTTSQYLLFH